MIKKIIIVALLLVTFTTTTVRAEEIPINRWNIQLTADEIELVSRIVQLECGHDIRESKYATIETIFNRIFDPRYPNTVEEVLSQKGQFSTWKNRNIAKATPTDDTYECVAMEQKNVHKIFLILDLMDNNGIQLIVKSKVEKI